MVHIKKNLRKIKDQTMDSPGFEFQLSHLSLTCHCLRDEIFF